MQAELDNLDLVKVTGRCDRVKEVAPWKRNLRQHAGVILALATTGGCSSHPVRVVTVTAPQPALTAWHGLSSVGTDESIRYRDRKSQNADLISRLMPEQHNGVRWFDGI